MYQLELACLGVAQNVQNQQTEHGIKDAYTQFWIEDLIVRSRSLRRNTESTSAQIQTELLAWVHENKNAIYNPFLTLEGEFLSKSETGR